MAYIDTIASLWEPMETLQHHATMINIRLEGNYAESESYGLHFMQMRTPAGLEDIVVGGRFLDKFERRNNVWKFLHRTHTIDWSTLSKPSRLSVTGPMFDGSLRAEKDETDPSYTFFRLFKRGTWSTPHTSTSVRQSHQRKRGKWSNLDGRQPIP